MNNLFLFLPNTIHQRINVKKSEKRQNHTEMRMDEIGPYSVSLTPTTSFSLNMDNKRWNRKKNRTTMKVSSKQ